MNVQSIIGEFGRREILLVPDGDGLIVEPASKLTDQDRQLIRQYKTELLRVLSGV
jgi:hypothetical protein